MMFPIDLLRLLLPMAKGYAHAHPVGSNEEYIREAESWLEWANREPVEKRPNRGTRDGWLPEFVEDAVREAISTAESAAHDLAGPGARTSATEAEVELRNVILRYGDQRELCNVFECPSCGSDRKDWMRDPCNLNQGEHDRWHESK